MPLAYSSRDRGPIARAPRRFADLVGPLVVDEILIRLLRTPIGARVAQIGSRESSVHRIAQAVSWIRAHFEHPLRVEDMATSARMSASAFHERFKRVTSMSPLQYQKHLNASDACQRVGYLSASQFSREYSRVFGSAPTRDVARLRAEGVAAKPA